jgi:hypothetical protein
MYENVKNNTEISFTILQVSDNINTVSGNLVISVLHFIMTLLK